MISNQKFVDWDGLVYYDGKIKKYVDDNVANCIKFGGLVSFNTLPRPSYQNLNYTYTVTDSFKSNEFFVEPGLTYARNTTVQVVEVNGMYLYSVFRENEVDLSAINYNIAVLQQQSEKSSAAIRELESDLKDQSDKLDRALGSMTDTSGGIEELSKTVNQMDELLDGLHESVVKLDGRVDDLYAAQTTISNNLIDVREAVCEKANKSDLEGLATEEFVKEAVEQINVPEVDLSNYYTKDEVNLLIPNVNDVARKEDLEGLASEEFVARAISAIEFPAAPTKVSELENDAGYITINDINTLASTTEVYALNLTGLDSFSELTPEQDKIVSALYDTDTTDSERRPSVITYIKDTQLNTNWVLVNTVSTHIASGLGYITLQTAPLLKNSDESVSVEYYEFTFRRLNSAAAEWIFYNAKRVTTDNLATVDELNTLANRIDTIVVPEIDLSNYYNKTEVEKIIEEAVDNIDIPEVPTKVSQLENDAGYVTSADLTDREVYTLNISNYTANQHVTPEQDLILSRLYDEEPHDTNRTPVVVTYVKDTQLDWQWRFITRVSTDPFTGMYDKYLTLYSSTEMHQGDEETSFSNCVYKFAKHSYDTSWFLVNAEKIKLDNVATEQFVKDSIDAINIPEVDLSNFYNKTEVENIVEEAVGNIKVPEVPTNVSAFVNDAGYITEHQDLSAYALKSDIPSIDGLASEEYVQLKVAEAQLGGSDGNVDLSVFVTQEQLEKELTEVTTTLEQSIKYGEF